MKLDRNFIIVRSYSWLHFVPLSISERRIIILVSDNAVQWGSTIFYSSRKGFEILSFSLTKELISLEQQIIFFFKIMFCNMKFVFIGTCTYCISIYILMFTSYLSDCQRHLIMDFREENQFFYLCKCTV